MPTMLMVATSITASFTPSLFPCLTHWCAGSGCTEFAQDYTGYVLFVKRGSCDFQTKVCIHPCLHPPHACSATCTPLHTTAHLLHTTAHLCTPLHTTAHLLHTIAHNCTPFAHLCTPLHTTAHHCTGQQRRGCRGCSGGGDRQQQRSVHHGRYSFAHLSTFPSLVFPSIHPSLISRFTSHMVADEGFGVAPAMFYIAHDFGQSIIDDLTS
jgi:hypothetical protein